MDLTNATTDGRDYGMSKIWDKLPWKQAAKKWRDDAIFRWHRWKKAEAVATRRKELLRRAYRIIELYSPGQEILPEIYDELAEELGEEGEA